MIHDRVQTNIDAHKGFRPSERVLLWALRAWACCCRGQRLPAEPVATAFAALGVPAAATALDAAMTRIALATNRPLAVSCPPYGGLSDDERMLLSAAAAAQHGDRAAIHALLAEVLPPAAIALVGRALIDLGAQLAAAGLALPHPGAEAACRDAMVPARVTVPVPDVWPPLVPSTLH